MMDTRSRQRPSQQEAIRRAEIGSRLEQMKAFCELLFDEALKMSSQINQTPEAFQLKEFERVILKSKNLNARIIEFESATTHQGIQLRKMDYEKLDEIKESADRIESLILQKQRQIQRFQQVNDLEKGAEDRILNRSTPTNNLILEPLETNVENNLERKTAFPDNEDMTLIYEHSDMGEIRKILDIQKAYEKNKTFTAVVDMDWSDQSVEERMQQIKYLVAKVGFHLEEVRIVNENGDLLANCKEKRIRIYK